VRSISCVSTMITVWRLATKPLVLSRLICFRTRQSAISTGITSRKLAITPVCLSTLCPWSGSGTRNFITPLPGNSSNDENIRAIPLRNPSHGQLRAAGFWILDLAMLLAIAEPSLAAIAKPAGGTVGFVAVELATGRTLGLNRNQPFLSRGING